MPRIEREELINIAVVLHCKQSKYLNVCIGEWRDRALVLDPSVDVDSIGQALESVACVCAPPDGHSRRE